MKSFMMKISLLCVMCVLSLPVKAATAPITYSMGFPVAGNWWKIKGFPFGGFNEFFNSWHLGQDTKPSMTPYGTPVFAPCSGEVVVSDEQRFGGYGSDSSANPKFKGVALLIQCMSEAGQPFVARTAHVQPGSENYDATTHTGLAPRGTMVRQGQYIARINHYWHGPTQSIDWPHVDLAFRWGTFDPEAVGAFVLGYSGTGWLDASHTQHTTWINPDTFIKDHSMKALWHPEGALVQAYGDSAIYQVLDGTLHHLVDESVFNAHGFSWTAVVLISEQELACYPEGEDITTKPIRSYFRYNNTYYLTEKNCPTCECSSYQFASATAARSWGMNANQVVDISAAMYASTVGACYDTKSTLYIRPGTIIRPTTSFLSFGKGIMLAAVQNGILRPFATEEAFGRLGYRWDAVMEVMGEELASAYQSIGSTISLTQVFACSDESLSEGKGGGPVCWDGDMAYTYTGTAQTAGIGQCRSQVELCQGEQWMTVQQQQLPVPEIADGLDNDCDGEVDNGLAKPIDPATADLDGDGQSLAEGDCDDDDPDVNEFAVEVCDNKDNNCDDVRDEDLEQPCVTSCGSGVRTCHAGTWNDCEVVLFNPEVCDGQDNDCDGEVDEGCTVTQPPIVPPVDADQPVTCKVTCPAPMIAYVWYGSGTEVSGQLTTTMATTVDEICIRGQPWVDFNCAMPGWTSFDPLKAQVTCSAPFSFGLGTIDYKGEGEIWFTDMSCQ